jgi:hypothetical protein
MLQGHPAPIAAAATSEPISRAIKAQRWMRAIIIIALFIDMPGE